MPTRSRRTSRTRGSRVRLEREAQSVTKAGRVERRRQPRGVLREPRPVVDEERRPVAASERPRRPHRRSSADRRGASRPGRTHHGRERGAHRTGRASQWVCSGAVGECRCDEPEPGCPAIRAVDDIDAERLEHSARGLGDVGDRLIERLGIPRRWHPVVAHLADELECGGFDLAGRRVGFRSSEGLDASAHVTSVTLVVRA